MKIVRRWMPTGWNWKHDSNPRPVSAGQQRSRMRTTFGVIYPIWPPGDEPKTFAECVRAARGPLAFDTLTPAHRLPRKLQVFISSVR